MTTKQCTTCGQVKSVDEFALRKRSRDGKETRCRSCVRIQKAAYDKTPRGQEVRKKSSANYSASEKGRASIKRVRQSSKRKLSNLKYIRGPKLKRAKAASVARIQTRITGVGGSFTGEQFRALCEQYGNVCLCCQQAKPLTVDHVIPIVAGGSSDIGNIQPLCGSCNRKKGILKTDYRKENFA